MAQGEWGALAPCSLWGQATINHVSCGGVSFLPSSLRSLVQNVGIANWPPAFDPQVSGLASEF